MLHIYKDYFIGADDNCFKLNRLTYNVSQKTGERYEVYKPLGYFSSLDRAYAFFIREVEREILMDDTQMTIREFITRMNEVISKLTFTIKEFEELKLAYEMKFDSEDE